jgi:hypothetical protein
MFSLLGFSMHLVFNERRKHQASWCNALATALMAAGAFAPAAAFLYGISTLPIGAVWLAAIVFACVALGIALHLLGSAILGRLRE